MLCSWEASELPQITLAAKTVAELPGCHVFFVFMDRDRGNADDRLGESRVHTCVDACVLCVCVCARW